MEIYHPEEKEVLREMRRVRRKAKRERLGRGLLIWLALGAITGWLVFNRFYTLAWVQGPAMNDTILSGSLVVCKRNNGMQPSQGDLVLFEHGEEWQIKRVIALEGDRVVVSRYGEIRINGRVLEEDYTFGHAEDTGILARRVNVPERQLFVAGDMRSLSVDSRFSNYGTVPEESVVATAEYVIWPLYRFGRVAPAEKTEEIPVIEETPAPSVAPGSETAMPTSMPTSAPAENGGKK